ncbi:MAG: hypothetical protein HY319_08680 [Armatimonadetes bacterium]|nr:hypothetical protein [Armatimonadota bacterium]
MGIDPEGLAWDEPNGFLYVANAASGTVSVIPRQTLEENFTTQQMGPLRGMRTPMRRPFDVAIANGKVFVTDPDSGTVRVFRAFSRQVNTLRMVTPSLNTVVRVGADIGPIIVTAQPPEACSQERIRLSLVDARTRGEIDALNRDLVRPLDNNCQAEFRDLAIGEPGTYRLRAAGLVSGAVAESGEFQVLPADQGQGSRLVFSVQPDDGVVNELLPPVRVAVLNEFNQVDTTPREISLFPLTGLGGTLNQMSQAGVANFGDLRMSEVGTFRLTARSPGLAEVQSSLFVIANTSGNLAPIFVTETNFPGLVLLAYDRSTGVPVLRGADVPSEGDNPEGVVYDPAANLAFVTNRNSDNVAVFRPNAELNNLTFLGPAVGGVLFPRPLVLAPNNRLYVAETTRGGVHGFTYSAPGALAALPGSPYVANPALNGAQLNMVLANVGGNTMIYIPRGNSVVSQHRVENDGSLALVSRETGYGLNPVGSPYIPA